MNTKDLQKIAPHLIIVAFILVVSYFVASPFLDKYFNAGQVLDLSINISKPSQEQSELGTLIDEIFESSQLDNLVSIDRELPIAPERKVDVEEFEEIRREGQLGPVQRKNPFASF